MYRNLKEWVRQKSKNETRATQPPCLSRRGAFVVWRLPRAPRPALLQGVCRGPGAAGAWRGPLGPAGLRQCRWGAAVSSGVPRCLLGPRGPLGGGGGNRWRKRACSRQAVPGPFRASGGAPRVPLESSVECSCALWGPPAGRGRFRASGGPFRKWLWRALWRDPVAPQGLRRLGAVLGLRGGAQKVALGCLATNERSEWGADK